MELKNNAAMNKKLYRTSLIIILFVFSITSLSGITPQRYQDMFSNKKETMKSVLKALEEGREYDSEPYWREKQYGFSFHPLDHEILEFDYDWDFPEIYIDESIFEDMEKRFEMMEMKMQEKMRELEKRLDSLNQRLSGKYENIV